MTYHLAVECVVEEISRIRTIPTPNPHGQARSTRRELSDDMRTVAGIDRLDGQRDSWRSACVEHQCRPSMKKFPPSLKTPFEKQKKLFDFHPRQREQWCAVRGLNARPGCALPLLPPTSVDNARGNGRYNRLSRERTVIDPCSVSSRAALSPITRRSGQPPPHSWRSCMLCEPRYCVTDVTTQHYRYTRRL